VAVNSESLQQKSSYAAVNNPDLDRLPAPFRERSWTILFSLLPYIQLAVSQDTFERKDLERSPALPIIAQRRPASLRLNPLYQR
jgi:hypothetical protein